jgi:MFS family permease
MAGQLLPITALLVSTFLMLAGGGLAGLLLPLRAGLEGWTPTTIGWIGTGYALAFTSGCIVVPLLVRRVGHVRVFATLLTGLSMSLLLQALVINPILWTLFRGIAGFSLAGGYMVVESWLNERVTNETRGKVFSVYMIVSMVGTMVGQYVLPFGNVRGPNLFIIAALIYASAVIPTALSAAQSPQPLTQVRLDLRGLFAKSPAAAVGTLISGIIAGGWNYLAPVYGGAIGLSTFQVATMLASAMIGGAVFQYPLGRASDRVDRRYVMSFAGLVGLAISLAMITFQHEPPAVIFGLMFLFGSVLYPIYSLNVAHANDFASPNEFVKVSSGLLIVYGIGSMAGPQIAGRMMDGFGPRGFFTTMAIAYSAYAAYSFWRSLRRPPVAPEERSDFKAQAAAVPHTPETYRLHGEGETDGEITAK